MTRGRRRTALVVLGLAVLVLVVVLGIPLLDGGVPAERTAATAFATAWSQDRLPDVAWDAPAGADPAADLNRETAGLLPGDHDHPQASVGTVRRTGERATADVDLLWQLTSTQQWRYRISAGLHRVGGRWLVVPAPTLAHPQLAGGQVLRTRSIQAPRAAVLGAGGAPLVQARPVVRVGIAPNRTTDLPGTVRALSALLPDVDAAALLTRAQAAAPTAFVDVITLRREAYDPLRDRLQAVSGAVFQQDTQLLPPTSQFARALLGSVGPVTAELVQAGKGRLQAGDLAGLSGLQAQYDAQLAGASGLVVEEVPAAGGSGAGANGSGAAGSTASPVRLLERPPVPGTPLRLTLDTKTQLAADQALAAAPKPAALVALRASTGELLAVANGGAGGLALDRALLGRYPPGSTFKIASTLALLRAGVSPTDAVPCPASVTVNGKVFTNAESEVLGAVPFSTDFANSCNTAFVGSAGRVPADQLTAAARDLGYTSYALSTPSFGGQVPATTDPVVHAATMIGQGQVLASPLAVALTAATVASGSYHPPRLLADAPAPAAGAALDPKVVQTLRALMRQVVTSGTGTALRSVPGGEVSGKTGTAEFGSQVPPQTHAWFTGYQGDVAFAVLVEDGGFGAKAAAPLAATFLQLLAG